MSHPHHPQTAKEKKLAQLKKNKFQQMLFNFVRLRGKEQERIEEMEEGRALKRKKNAKEHLDREKKDEEEVWSAKVGTIRNRLTDKKRVSDDRWNRFAGTESGGGRGR